MKPAVFFVTLGVQGFRENRRFPRHSSITDHTCLSPLKILSKESGIHYLTMNQNQNWMIADKIPPIPCGKKTLEKCDFLSQDERRVTYCKHYQIEGLVWGPYTEISKQYICKRPDCNVYMDIKQVQHLFSQYTESWDSIKPFIHQDSWLYSHIPKSWPKVPLFNIPNSINIPGGSQLMGSILTIQLTEITRLNNFMYDIKKPDFLYKTVHIPVQSFPGEWMMKLDISNYGEKIHFEFM